MDSDSFPQTTVRVQKQNPYFPKDSPCLFVVVVVESNNGCCISLVWEDVHLKLLLFVLGMALVSLDNGEVIC